MELLNGHLIAIEWLDAVLMNLLLLWGCLRIAGCTSSWVVMWLHVVVHGVVVEVILHLRLIFIVVCTLAFIAIAGFLALADVAWSAVGYF